MTNQIVSHEDSNSSFIKDVVFFKINFTEWLSELCKKWGAIVYDHTGKVMISAFCLFLLTLIGFVPGIPNWLEGAFNLYTLPNTEAQKGMIIHETVFNSTLSLPNFLIITTDPPGGNLLTWENLEKVQEIDNLIRGRILDPIDGKRIALPALDKYLPNQTSKGTIDINNYDTPYAKHGYNLQKYRSKVHIDNIYEDDYYLTFEDICYISPFGKCQIISIFEMGIWDIKKMLPKNAPPELYIMNGYIFNSEKKAFVPDFVLGNYTSFECEREFPTSVLLNLYSMNELRPGSDSNNSIVTLDCVTSVEAFNFIYELHDKPEYRIRNFAWMDIFYDVLRKNKHYDGLLLSANSFKSRDDELRNSTSESKDLIFVVFTFLSVIAYTAFMNFSIDLYKNKSIAAFAGSLSALLGIVSGFGFSSLVGVSFVPTALVMPFLIMGIVMSKEITNPYLLLVLQQSD
ncbi:Niemann-Pick type C1-related protein-like [Dermatophagoides farinae]|uniref:Niemann-Pick type C1-related protein-like n=1 Tax=Dermatophagoides farinae TaxID=6954 RepID=UPI003F6305F3